MPIDETIFHPGDTDNNLLRKILATLHGAGGSSNIVTVAGGNLTSGGAVTIADGAAVTLGAKADTFTTNPAISASLIALTKGILTDLNAIQLAEGFKTDAAVTNPASDATIISALKGILTGVNLNQNVGGYTVAIKDTTAVSTSPAYSIGDAVGAKRTITGALRTSNGSGILESITLLDRANQKAAMELFIFDSNPAAATITDNAAFVFSTDDLKVLAHVTIAATDYITINSKAIATIKGIGAALKGADSTTSLYAALVTTGTPTYAATTDLQLIYGILQD